MVDFEVWAGCMSSLTQLVCTLDCMNLVPVLLRCHSTLYDRHLLHTSIDCFGRFGQVNGLNTRHLLQFPPKLTLSAMHLYCLCCHFVLKHSALL
jgi:hypothetical protein